MQLTNLVLRHRAMCGREVVDRGRLVRLTAATAAAAAVVNGAIYFIAKAAGAVSPDVTTMSSSPLSLAQVVIASVIAVGLAATALMIIGRIMAHPARMFQALAAAMFAISLSGPIGLKGVTFAMAISLIAMHLVTFLMCNLVLLNALRPANEK